MTTVTTVTTTATTTMTGGGDYDRNARVQATAASFALPLLERAAREAALPPPPAPVAIVDYGSATGKNSMPVLAAALKVIRLRTAQSVLFAHNDQPTNDFASLFATLASPAGYLAGDPGVFACAVGRSFTSRSFRPASSAWAGRRRPRTGCRACPRRSPIARGRPRRGHPAPNRFSPRHAAIGAVSSISARPRRAPVAGWSSSSRPSTTTASAAASMRWTVSTKRCAPRSRMARSPGSEADALVVPNFFLSREELEAPFGEPALRGRLQLVEHLRVISADPLWDAFERGGDAGSLAAAFAGWVRAFSQSSLLAALGAERSADERQRLASRLYAAIETRVRANPERARCAWRMAALDVGRIA